MENSVGAKNPSDDGKRALLQAPSNKRLKLTRGEGSSHGAHSRARLARGILSRRAQLNRVLRHS